MRATEVLTAFWEGGLERVAHEARIHGLGIEEQRVSAYLRSGKVASHAWLRRGDEVSLTRTKKRRVVSWPRVMTRVQGWPWREKKGLW
jgi:hypothetical protein